MVASTRRTLIIIPTYNERDNIEVLLNRIRQLRLRDTDLLVIDDNSSDGTADFVSSFAVGNPWVRLLRRPGKLGLGSAYITGMQTALSQGYQWVVQMDADLSHDPEYLPEMLRLATQHPVVIGSRYVKGGQTRGWPMRRKVLSAGANLLTRLLLSTRTKDSTAGFRCYRCDVLEAIFAEGLDSKGFIFQVEMTFAVERLGFFGYEMPIVFQERQLGKSKMGVGIMGEGLLTLLKLRRRWQHVRARAREAT